MWRVDGRAICPHCGEEYRSAKAHPLVKDVLDWQEEPFVYRACELGVVLKL